MRVRVYQVTIISQQENISVPSSKKKKKEPATKKCTAAKHVLKNKSQPIIWVLLLLLRGKKMG